MHNTTAVPVKLNICARRMLSQNGRPSSMASVSFENRLMILPTGVDSMNVSDVPKTEVVSLVYMYLAATSQPYAHATDRIRVKTRSPKIGRADGENAVNTANHAYRL